MPSLVAGASRARFASRRRRLVRVSILAVVAAGVLAVVWLVILHRVSDKTPPQPAVRRLSFLEKQTADVSLVAGAVGQYAAAYDALPTRLVAGPSGSLVLCGPSCDPTDYEVGGLSTYQAANIKLMPYTTDLAAPSQYVMYLVPGAKCASNGYAGLPNATLRSMVILYAGVTGATVTPHCLVL